MEPAIELRRPAAGLRRPHRAARDQRPAGARARASRSWDRTARASRRCCGSWPACCGRAAGEVSVLGCALPKETHRLRGPIGYLGHEPLLYRDLSPRENLDLVAALHGLDPAGAAKRIERLLEAVGMSRRSARPGRRALGGDEAAGRHLPGGPARAGAAAARRARRPPGRRGPPPGRAPDRPRHRSHAGSSSATTARRRRRAPTSSWSSDEPLRRPAAQGPPGGAPDASLPPCDGALRRQRLRHLPLRPRPHHARR